MKEKKIVTKLYLLLLTKKNISIEIYIDINSSKNIHSIKLEILKHISTKKYF